MDLLGVAGIAFFTTLGGGTVWDLTRTPQVLRHELYASVSPVFAFRNLTLLRKGVNENVTLRAAFSLGLLLRMAAIRWRWSLPVFSYSQARRE